MTTTRRRAYTEDFKRDAEALVREQGYSVAEAARSLDIGASLLEKDSTKANPPASGN